MTKHETSRGGGAIAMDELRTTSEPAESPAETSTEGVASGATHLYAQAMQQNPLLDREGEHALGAEIEERSYALWAALLAHAPTVVLVARLAAESLPEAAPALRRVERASGKARALAVRTARERLHAIDADHLVADAAVGLIAASAHDRAGAPPELRAGLATRAYARHAEVVADAARAVADARKRFVQANIGLVFHIAGRYRSPSFSYEDFVQEGMFGLIKAVDRFDRHRGLRFSTYATWWIRHSMGRALADKSQVVRVPVHLQEARQRLASVHKALRTELAREPSQDELARAAGMSREKVERIRQASVVREVRLDAPIGEDADQALVDVFVDPSAPTIDAGETLHRQALAGVAQQHMAALSAMEREVLRRRFALDGDGREDTFQQIARDHGLSRERIRQIQESALRKLRTRLARLGDDESPARRAA
jgi:RNA polymerase primary sigma factor